MQGSHPVPQQDLNLGITTYVNTIPKTLSFAGSAFTGFLSLESRVSAPSDCTAANGVQSLASRRLFARTLRR
jgi:hypothetical protein